MIFRDDDLKDENSPNWRINSHFYWKNLYRTILSFPYRVEKLFVARFLLNKLNVRSDAIRKPAGASFCVSTARTGNRKLALATSRYVLF